MPQPAQPQRVANAALLAAQAPPDGAYSPIDLELGPAWLDLRGEDLLVAFDRANGVLESLAACLNFQESSRLFITVDPPHDRAVATLVAVPLIRDGMSDLQIAVLRGENVLSGLEEFLVAGCELRNEAPPHQSLKEDGRTPFSAVAKAPSSTLRDAVEAGAQIVISQTADRETIEAAIGDGPAPDHLGGVTLRFGRRHEAVSAFHDERPLEELRFLLEGRLPDGADLRISEADGLKVLRLSSAKRKTFKDACRRCNLLLNGLPTSLDKLWTPVYDQWKTSVPAELLEFGFELRSSTEWREI